jgi:hypothetical protein
MEVEIHEMLLSIPMNRTPDQPYFLRHYAPKNKGTFSCFRRSCFRKQVEPVSIFRVSSCFCFLSFCF